MEGTIRSLWEALRRSGYAQDYTGLFVVPSTATITVVVGIYILVSSCSIWTYGWG